MLQIKMLLIKHRAALWDRTALHTLNVLFFIVITNTCTHPKGLTSRVIHTAIFAYQDSAHQSVHIHYKPSDNTQPDIHTLPSRLPSQQSKHSCQNSGTSNTTIVIRPGSARERQREKKTWMLNWHFWTTHMLQIGPLLVGSTFPASLLFFSPFTPFFHSCYLHPCLSNTLSFLPSIYFFLSFAPGTVHCCLTSALITAPGRPLSTSRLACESTRPRAVITLKSSKSGHVKLRKVFQEPTQVSEEVNWKLAQGQICMSKYTWWFRLHHKVGLELQSLDISVSKCCRSGLWVWGQVWTRVRNPVGTQKLRNQNFCLKYSQQALFGWTGCNNIFSPFPSQIPGKKRKSSLEKFGFISTADPMQNVTQWKNKVEHLELL